MSTTPTPSPRPATDPAQITVAQLEYQNREKQPLIMYLLWFFTGGLGGHRYYLGDIGLGIAMTCTLGGLGVWALADVLFIGARRQRVNDRIRREVFARHGIAA